MLLLRRQSTQRIDNLFASKLIRVVYRDSLNDLCQHRSARERRAGTESVANTVAFGVAAELAQSEMKDRNEHVHALRDRFENEVVSRIGDIVFNGRRDQRLPHLSNISFRFIEGEGLLIHLDMNGVAVSTGSACSSGTLEPSPVIRALGRDEELARGSIRFSFGKDNIHDDVDYAVAALVRAVESLRALSPLTQDSVRHASHSHPVSTG